MCPTVRQNGNEREKKMNAQQAIAQSIAQNEIVHIEATPEITAELSEQCEQSVETNDERGTVEYWGGDAQDSWRVHTHAAE